MKVSITWALGGLLTASALVATIVASAGPAGAIVGGTTPGPSDYRYFVQITAGSTADSAICGGTLITTEWILTAAHCVPGGSRVLVCNGNFCGNYLPDRIVVHPLWNNNNRFGGHDLALYHMSPGQLTGVAVMPQVGSPWDPGAYRAGTPATIMGHGRTSSGGPASSTLLAANTTLVSDDQMDSIFNPTLLSDNWNEPMMIGAGSPSKTICTGDSGSPLIVNRNGHAVQVGVASFMYTSILDSGCDNPGGFAELSGPQLAWVASVVPSIAGGWGGCVAASGAAGQPTVDYGPYVWGAAQDGPMYWSIWCADPTPPAYAPNVIGLNLTAATNSIAAAGLTLGPVRNVVDHNCTSINEVVSQSPAASTQVPPGTPISLTIATKPASPCR